MASQPTEDEIRDEVEQFLRRELPQIQMHGGESSVTNVDLDERSVTIQLGGTCSGCGISPMTIQAIKQRLPDDVDYVETVYAGTGMDDNETLTPSVPVSEDDEDDTPEAPF